MKREGQKGETLLEVIITTMIISIALVSLIQLTYVNFDSVERANQKGYATYLTQDAAEMITNIRDTGVKIASIDPATMPRWNKNLCDPNQPACNNGYYYFKKYDTTTGWILGYCPKDASNCNFTTAPCYSCAAATAAPIYPTLSAKYLADDSDLAPAPGMDEALGDRDRDNPSPTTGTQGINYQGVTYYRYIYIEKWDDPTTTVVENSDDILRARIIVSWKQKNHVLSIGQDLLLTNLSES